MKFYDTITVDFYKDRFKRSGRTLQEVVTRDPTAPIMSTSERLRADTQEIVGVSHPCPNHQVALSQYDDSLGDGTRSILLNIDEG